MFRKIHYFGCSYTYGAGLKDRYTERYSYHLSKLFNSHHHNYSKPAGSDYLSLITLMRLYKAKLIGTEDLIVFQWTQSNRHPIPLASEDATWHPDGMYNDNSTKRVVHYPFLDAYNTINQVSRDEKYFLENYITLTNPAAFSQFNNKVLKELLDGWLGFFGIPNIQFESHLHFTGNLGSKNWTEGSMFGFLRDHQFESLPCGHPSPEGHKRWAEHLYYMHQPRFENSGLL